MMGKNTYWLNPFSCKFIDREAGEFHKLALNKINILNTAQLVNEKHVMMVLVKLRRNKATYGQQTFPFYAFKFLSPGSAPI